MEAIITYTLPLSQLPRHPDKEWRGRIIRPWPHGLLVESLEPGYEHETEYVPLEHVKSVQVVPPQPSDLPC